MCYELWRYEQMRAEEEEAKRRARDKMKTVKSAPPVTKVPEPVTADEDKEAVPA